MNGARIREYPPPVKLRKVRRDKELGPDFGFGPKKDKDGRSLAANDTTTLSG